MFLVSTGNNISARTENNIPQKPNIILIVIDTLRADHLPFYGYQKNTAPFLDSISNQCFVFDNACAASSWTAPSTASIFTSLYPFQHGVITGFFATEKLQKDNMEIVLNKIPDVIPTIPEILRSIGYKTYGFAANINISQKLGFARGFDVFAHTNDTPADVLNREIIKWSGNMKASSPYFLYIHYNDPHFKYRKRKPWYQKNEDAILDTISAYDSEISYVDEKIREIFDLLELADSNTLLIITSDHGEEFNDHGDLGHGKNFIL